MKAQELREKYLNFFKSKKHAIVPSASLIPENDPSTLFISSGMQPLIPYLMGEKHPEGNRIVDIQKSFRSGDIEEVGDNRHTTCFEMLGNWSLGDYFKKEQLNWFWEFLTKELKLDPLRLYVTVFRGNKEIGVEKDNTSVEIWKEIFSKEGIEAQDADFSEKNGMQEGERIFYYDEYKNWWSRSGAPANMPVGEIGGPDSEVFYDMGEHLKRHENSKWKNNPCHVNCDCGRFIEIGNSVFIEFIKKESGFEPLSQKNVDFGGGLERIAMILQKKDNIFETDLYINIIRKIEELSGKKYRESMPAFEVVADHIKGAVMLMGDDKGIAPSNVDQGYIIRRLLRRAIRYGKQLGIVKQDWTREVAQIVINDYKQAYAELERNQNFILSETEKEENKFNMTLEKGLKELLKLTLGLEINPPFDERKKLIRRQTTEINGKTLFYIFSTYGFPLELSLEEIQNNLKALYNQKLKNRLSSEFYKEFKKHQELSRTAAEGKFKGGLADHDKETTALHTTAHLLLASLRKVLGDHVHQKGSNITAKRLRLDFSHNEKLSDEQKENVIKLVNQVIEAKLPINMREMTVEEAKKAGAEGVFDSKYGEKVKVYTIGEGDNIFSKEICGGPHVKNTGDLGIFRIKKEQSSSSGVRRIKAVLEK